MDSIMHHIADLMADAGTEVEFLEDNTIGFIIDDYEYQVQMITKDIYP